MGPAIGFVAAQPDIVPVDADDRYPPPFRSSMTPAAGSTTDLVAAGAVLEGKVTGAAYRRISHHIESYPIDPSSGGACFPPSACFRFFAGYQAQNKETLKEIPPGRWRQGGRPVRQCARQVPRMR